MMSDTNGAMISRDTRRKPWVAFRETVVSLLITLMGASVWFYAGGIFHRTLQLFTRLDHTWINIWSAFGGFVIMTSCAVVAAYLVRRFRENKRNEKDKKQDTIVS